MALSQSLSSLAVPWNRALQPHRTSGSTFPPWSSQQGTAPAPLTPSLFSQGELLMSLPKADVPASLHIGVGGASPLHLHTHPRGATPPLTASPRRTAGPNPPASPDLSSKCQNAFLTQPLNDVSIIQKSSWKDPKFALVL